MKRGGERAATALLWLCWIGLAGAAILLIGHLLARGWHALGPALFFGGVPPLDVLLYGRGCMGGILPALAGSVILVVLAVSIALPVGMGAGIYLAEYAHPGVKRVVSFFLDILAAVPSIVIGLFGLSLVILLHRHVSPRFLPSLLCSGLSLSVLILPYLVRSTELALEGVPLAGRLSGLACGATRLQNVTHVLIPQALSGILKGVILATARSAEDAAVIMLTGAVALAGMPRGLLEPFEAVPFFIFHTALEYRNQTELTLGYGAAIVLLVLCLFLFLVAGGLERTVRRRMTGLP